MQQKSPFFPNVIENKRSDEENHKTTKKKTHQQRF